MNAANVTYRALAERVGRQAAMLADGLGVRHGDRVAYLGLNNPEMLALLFACARVGAVFVPMNWRLAPPEHRETLVDCAPAVVFAESELAADLEGIRDDLSGVRPIRMGPPAAGWLGYDDLLTAAPPDRRLYGADYADPVLLRYTWGSTGRPKGAVLTQSALLWNAINSTHMHDLTSADRILTTLPMCHVGGLNVQTLPALHAGATVLLHRKFDVGATFAAIAEDRPTLALLVPTQIAALVDDARWASADLSSLRLLTTGATTVPERLIHAVHARGVPVIQVYGSTETAPIAVYLAAADARRKAGSAGKAAIHCEMRLVDALGCDVPPGVPGEILVRGRNLMCGYWNDSELTAQALLDGWFHSGDIGHLDEEGFLFVDGRIKVAIVSGGESICPAPLEAILGECPGEREMAKMDKSAV